MLQIFASAHLGWHPRSGSSCASAVVAVEPSRADDTWAQNSRLDMRCRAWGSSRAQLVVSCCWPHGMCEVHGAATSVSYAASARCSSCRMEELVCCFLSACSMPTSTACGSFKQAVVIWRHAMHSTSVDVHAHASMHAQTTPCLCSMSPVHTLLYLSIITSVPLHPDPVLPSLYYPARRGCDPHPHRQHPPQGWPPRSPPVNAHGHACWGAGVCVLLLGGWFFRQHIEHARLCKL